MTDSVKKLAAERRRQEKERLERLDEQSAERLARIIEKKVKTIIFGGVACIEDYFGELWGHGRPLSSLTERQKKWREHWEICRTDILDYDHKQLRNILKELEEYKVTWLRKRLRSRPS